MKLKLGFLQIAITFYTMIFSVSFVNLRVRFKFIFRFLESSANSVTRTKVEEQINLERVKFLKPNTEEAKLSTVHRETAKIVFTK